MQTSKTEAEEVQDIAAVVRPENKDATGGLVNLCFWFGGSAVLGWRANVMWHDKVDPLCLKEVASPLCWEFGDLYYQFLGVGIAAGCSWLAGRFMLRAFKLPLRGCTMAPDSSRLSAEKLFPVEKEKITGRWLHEMVHAAFGVSAFFFWKYIVDNEDEGGKSHEWIKELPLMRVYFQGFMTVIPTICAEIMAIRAYEKKPMVWAKEDSIWAFSSMGVKTLLFLANDFILAPQTQRVWDKEDDSSSQRNLVIAIATICGFLIMYFWRRFARSCNSCALLHQQSWACVDFPVFMVIVAQIAWNVTARLDDQHDIVTMPFDFLSQLLYGYLLLLGIFNINVHLISKASSAQGKYAQVGKFQITADLDDSDDDGAL